MTAVNTYHFAGTVEREDRAGVYEVATEGDFDYEVRFDSGPWGSQWTVIVDGEDVFSVDSLAEVEPAVADYFTAYVQRNSRDPRLD